MNGERRVRAVVSAVTGTLDLPSILVALALGALLGAGTVLLPGAGGEPILLPETLVSADWGIAPGPRSVPPDVLQRSAFESLVGLVLVLVGIATAIALFTALALETARESGRRTGMAVRAAIGAPPALLLRRLARERLLPLLAVGVLGGIVAGAGIAIGLALTWPGDVTLAPPPSALATAILLVVAAVSVVALLPLRHAREPLASALASGSATPHWREGGLRRVLSVLQLGAGLAILAGAATAIGAPTPGGTDASDGDGTVLLHVALDPALTPEERRARWTALLDRARSAPTFTSESIATPGAWSGVGRRDFVLAECGACVIGGMYVPFLGEHVFQHVVTPGFFEQAGLELLQGRSLGPGDAAGSERVVVVSRSFALSSFEDGDPIDHRVRLGRGEDTWHTVVGVVADPPGVALGRSAGAAPTVFLSALQHPPDRAELALSGTDPDPAVSMAVAGVLAEGGPELLSRRRARDRAPLDWFARTALAAAVLALLGALVGAWSVSAVEARARRREIGLRAALGASPRRLVLWMLGRTTRAAAVAVLLAVPLAVGVSGLLRDASGNVPLFDVTLFGTLAAALVVASTAGALGAARSAGRTDPARVLAGE